MYLSVLQQFQNDLYNLLSTNLILKKNIKNIYLKLQKNNHTPFIVVEFLTANNLTSVDLITYELSFNIAIFTHDLTHDRIMEIGEQILKTVTSLYFNKQKNKYLVVNLRFQSISWHVDKLFITDKFNIHYKSILQYCERYND
ncbi:hypothetical protein OCHUTO_0081 [Orientia chuto str. Dubai]|uniref:Uncharacterized protein n=1 Tax=Orientia chuto str. Dubai TaxID=1359168 RepID=A0A0F3MSC3_9RICK|nr:hypothetical protein [Candidatus Orientia mediorientalis]KJV57514.1 hypothetical protein OCHUTO_0081 [Orientia chuto str. Dubai]